MEVPEKAIPIPHVTWTGMQPHGMNRLLPLTLWLGLQYLGKGGCRRDTLQLLIAKIENTAVQRPKMPYLLPAGSNTLVETVSYCSNLVSRVDTV